MSVIEKANRVEEESFKCNRVQEENVGLKKKLDRAKKIEFLGASDEILVEEVKMYKVGCHFFNYYKILNISLGFIFVLKPFFNGLIFGWLRCAELLC